MCVTEIPIFSANSSCDSPCAFLYFRICCLSVIGEIAGTGSDTNGENNSVKPTSSSNYTVPSKNLAFEGDCGIAASAEMDSSIIGYPELTISITNTTEMEISAIQFYAVPYDVYGEEVKGWTSQNKLYTDTAIGAGESDSISFPFIESSVKTIKLYVYSVYFADGPEWGDKAATKSTILNSGVIIEVSGNS
jgi:hypothetical protein